MSTTTAAAAAAFGALPTPSSGASQPAAKNTLGPDDFLKLLMAQMSNQDPLNPMDNTAFVAQLAQFSSVQLQQTTNSKLDTLAIGQAGANQTAAAALVGKQVTYSSNQIQLGNSGPAPVVGQLQGNAAAVTAVISDSSGRVVRTLNFGGANAGTFNGTWDGLDQNGSALPPGSYTVSLSAADVSGAGVSISPQGVGKVTGISFISGNTQLIVNGASISMGSVTEIDQAPTP